MGFQNTLKALCDPTRRAILKMLRQGPKTAGEIAAGFPLAGASISHHLSVLSGASLIFSKRCGRNIYYELNMSVIDELLSWITAFKEGYDDETKD